MITAYKVKCRDCGKQWTAPIEPHQSIYGAAYQIGARHERERAGKNCWLSAFRYVELTGIVTDDK